MDLGKNHVKVKNGIAYLAAGIGPSAAAFGLTHFLEDYRPKIMISVGTAGIINPKNLSLGDVVCANNAHIDSGLTETFTPSLCPAQSWPVPKIAAKYTNSLKRSNPVSVFCPQEISKTEKRRLALLKKGYDAENLELYAFAYVAKKFKIPHLALLGMSNHVSPNGHKEWMDNEAQTVGNISLFLDSLLDQIQKI